MARLWGTNLSNTAYKDAKWTCPYIRETNLTLSSRITAMHLPFNPVISLIAIYPKDTLGINPYA